MQSLRTRSYWQAVFALLAIPLIGLIYVYLNNGEGTTYSLVTDLDRQIPFLKIFVVPYLSWYAFLAAGFLYLAHIDRRVYYKTLARFIIGLLACYGVYAVYQTYVPRPELEGDGMLLGLVKWVYDADNPYNCFPSTHVLTSYLMMKAYLSSTRIRLGYKIVVTVMALLIIASTQFMKQHVLMDIFGAVVVAECVAYAMSRLGVLGGSNVFRSVKPADPTFVAPARNP